MRLSTTGKNIRQAAAAGAATNRFQAPDYRLQTAQVPRTGRSWTQQRQEPRPGGGGVISDIVW